MVREHGAAAVLATIGQAEISTAEDVRVAGGTAGDLDERDDVTAAALETWGCW